MKIISKEEIKNIIYSFKTYQSKFPSQKDKTFNNINCKRTY